jgi:hypothetical protein
MANPLKFRCYQCNQLLGVSRSKVGEIVSCPKCRAELLVPEPVEVAVATGDPGSSSVQSSANAGALDSGLPFELIDIRPEDIRVEPGVSLEVESPVPEMAPKAAEPTPTVSVPVARDRESPVTERFEPPPSAPPPTQAPPVLVADREPVVPPIQIDAPTRLNERLPVSRSRDLLLPRSTVAAWSIFVLLAQCLAFLAGLLAGHFIWRVH